MSNTCAHCQRDTDGSFSAVTVHGQQSFCSADCLHCCGSICPHAQVTLDAARAALAQARAEVERLTNEKGDLEAAMREEVNRVTAHFCGRMVEAVGGLKQRARTDESERDEARARARAAEAETVRRIVAMIRHCSRVSLERGELEFEAYWLALADAIEIGSWKETRT